MRKKIRMRRERRENIYVVHSMDMEIMQVKNQVPEFTGNENACRNMERKATRSGKEREI